MHLSCNCDQHSGGEKLIFGNPFLFLLLILSLGFILRVGWLLYARPVPVSDFKGYMLVADNLLDQHQLGVNSPSAYRLPGYPFFLAALMLISKSVLWLSLSNVVMTMVICIEVFFLTRYLINEQAALFACLICAINPAFIFFSPVLASEHLFASLLLGSMLAALASRRRGHLQSFLSGGLLGLAILTRGEGLFYVPIVLGIIIWPAHTGSSGRRVRSWLRTGVAFSAIMCVLLPWYIRNIRMIGTGAGLSTSGGMNFYFAHNPDTYGYHRLPQEVTSGLDDIQNQKQAYRLGWAYIKSNPWSLLRSTLQGTVLLYGPSTYGINWSSRLLPDSSGQDWGTRSWPGLKVFKVLSVVGYALLLLAIVLAPVARQYWTGLNVFVIAGTIFCNWLCYAVIFFAKPRYHYLVETFFCVIAGAVIVRFMNRRSISSGSTL